MYRAMLSVGLVLATITGLAIDTALNAYQTPKLESVDSLIATIRSPDLSAATKQKAVQQLASHKSEAQRALKVLVPLLDDKNSGMRRSVIVTLGAIGKPAVPSLLRAAHEDFGNCYEALSHLEKIGPDAGAAVPALILAVKFSGRSTDEKKHGRYGTAVYRGAAMKALAAAKPAPATLTPILQEMLFENPFRDFSGVGGVGASHVLAVISQMGSDASPLVPSLQRILLEYNDHRKLPINQQLAINRRTGYLTDTVARNTAKALGTLEVKHRQRFRHCDPFLMIGRLDPQLRQRSRR